MDDSDRPPTLGRLLALALPLIGSQAGSQLTSLVDTAMVGRLGEDELSGVGIANGVFFTITLLGLGCVLGMDAPVSQAVGAREPARARRILWQGIWVAVAVSLPLSVLVALSPALLEPAGVHPGIAREARTYLLGRVPGVAPFLVFVALRSYLQAHGRTRPMILAVVVTNVTNVIGNGLLMYGDGALRWAGLPAIGLPPLGVLGAAISTTIGTVVQLGVLALALGRIATPPDPVRRRFDRALSGTILRLGFPVGVQILAECGIFTLVAILTGRLGAEVASAHQIAVQLASFSFCVTLGISMATSVMVGHSIGRGDTSAARRAGTLGLVASLLVMGSSGVVFLAAPRLLAQVLTDKPAIIVAAIPLIRIAGFFALSDGTQSTVAGALRGAGDARLPLVANLIGHYAIGLPIALLLGFSLDMGAVGLWWGLLAGLTATATGLVARFYALTARPVARV